MRLRPAQVPLFKFAIGCELPSMERLARRKIARQEAQRNVEYLFNVSHPTTCVPNKTQTSPSNWQQQQMGHCHVQHRGAKHALPSHVQRARDALALDAVCNECRLRASDWRFRGVSTTSRAARRWHSAQGAWTDPRGRSRRGPEELEHSQSGAAGRFVQSSSTAAALRGYEGSQWC